MWNHTYECNCRQPYDEWSYSNPSSAAPFPSSPISAETPGPCAANHVVEPRTLLRWALRALCHIYPLSVRMIICKWHRALAEVCYFKKRNKTSFLWCCCILPCSKSSFRLSPSDLSRSRIRGGGRKNKFREKSIIKIPYPTPPPVWPIGILQDPWPPYGVPNLQPGGREQRIVLSLRSGYAELRINR